MPSAPRVTADRSLSGRSRATRPGRRAQVCYPKTQVRSRTPSEGHGRCLRCLMKEALCVCEQLPSLANRTELLILRHVKEAPKSTNSARWAALMLERCSVVDIEGREDPAYALAEGADCLLFPEGDGSRPFVGVPRKLVVLDGTWRQTRRMLRASPALQALPRLTVSGPSRFAVRQVPEGGLSTLEAIACAIEALEGPEPAAALREGHRALYEGVLRARGRIRRAPPPCV